MSRQRARPMIAPCHLTLPRPTGSTGPPLIRPASQSRAIGGGKPKLDASARLEKEIQKAKHHSQHERQNGNER